MVMHCTLAILAFLAAVLASPMAMPQGVTAIITPTGSGAPPGCTPAYSGSFAIAVQALSSTAPTKRHVRRAPEPIPAMMMMGAVSQIGDGQVQAGTHTMMVMPITQISDGQPQAATMAPVTEFSDGQPQAPVVTVKPVSQITDGQPQAPTATAKPVSQITDGQPQAPRVTRTALSQKSDGQPQAPTSSVSTAGASPTQRDAVMAACKSPNTLSLTLNNGILKDSQGRTGYIADNYQFQFDAPPQAGALITAGFSVCGNGSLALGGSNIFYQCLSGSFYNIYNINWAPQCEPVIVNTLELIDCA